MLSSAHQDTNAPAVRRLCRLHGTGQPPPQRIRLRRADGPIQHAGKSFGYSGGLIITNCLYRSAPITCLTIQSIQEVHL